MPLENGPRMRHVLIGQIFVEGLRVDLARHARHLQNALQLAGEQQPARLVTVDERLLAQPIAGEHQLLPPGVPNGQGEHAVQMRHELRPFVFVEMDKHFGIAIGAEAMPGPFEPAAEVAEVIDFAVEDDPYRTVFVGQRLFAAGEVDDGQPPMAQGHVWHSRPRLCKVPGTAGGGCATVRVPIEVHTFAVRPAMAEHVDHPLERFLPHGLVGFVPCRAGDAAHDADNMPQPAAKQGQ